MAPEAVMASLRGPESMMTLAPVSRSVAVAENLKGRSSIRMSGRRNSMALDIEDPSNMVGCCRAKETTKRSRNRRAACRKGFSRLPRPRERRCCAGLGMRSCSRAARHLSNTASPDCRYAYIAPMMAPMLVPAIDRTGRSCRSNSWRTPMWANPRAPPPPRARTGGRSLQSNFLTDSRRVFTPLSRPAVGGDGPCPPGPRGRPRRLAGTCQKDGRDHR